VAGSCEYGDESSGSIKCGEFLKQRRTFKLLRKDSAPWSKTIVPLKADKTAKYNYRRTIFYKIAKLILILTESNIHPP
jgi:hypothetical protein